MAESYGRLYRQMREAKHVSLHDAAGDALSTAQLSRFETGKSQVTIDKLFALLENINVSPEEYAYMLRDFSMDYNTTFFAKALELERKLDFNGLRNLAASAFQKYQASGKDFYRLNSLYVKGVLTAHGQEERLTEDEQKLVTDFLTSTYSWGQYELHIFIGCCLQLDYRTSLDMSKNMLKRTQFYQRVPANQELICVMLKAMAATAIEHHDFDNASHLITLFSQFASKVWSLYAVKQEERALLANLYEEEGDLQAAVRTTSTYLQLAEAAGVNDTTLQVDKAALEELKARMV